MSDGFSFPVPAYSCHRCCDCPHFREDSYDYPSCTHKDANEVIREKLVHDYEDDIHKDCPYRPKDS